MITIIRLIKRFIEKKSTVNKDFLIWFIGFSEGDGSFVNRFIPQKKMTQIFFTITQKDPSVLYHIQNQFNFGIIKANCGPKKKYFYYLIYDYKGLTCLISLFNGNIILDKVYKRFDAFLKGYYDCFKTRTDLPVFIFNSNQPTIKLDNAWVSGFTQAEGGFYVGLEKRKGRNSKHAGSNYRLVTKYHLAQKDELIILIQIRNAFYKKILNRKTDSLSLVDMTYILSQKGRYQGFYQLQCSSKSYILVIIDYFNYNM